MNYGHFNKDYTEYIIDDPLTPRPWVNYLTNGAYTAIVSQCGGGYSFFNNCRKNRSLQTSPESHRLDRPGRYIYINDKVSGCMWSPTYQPVRSKYTSFKARHGLGYTIISSEVSHINAEITYFVPLHDACEVWIVNITNKDRKTKKLQIFPSVELYVGGNALFSRVWFDKKTQSIRARESSGSPGTVFFSSHLPIKGFATRKEEFLGKYNTVEAPESILSGSMHSTSPASIEDSIAVFHHEILLKPKQSKTFVVISGRVESSKALKQLIEKYHSVAKAGKELTAVQDYWRKNVLQGQKIETPDNELNAMLNVWLKYQILINNNGSGFTHFRRSCRNLEASSVFDPELSKKQIGLLAQLIRADGTCSPSWINAENPSQQKPRKDHPVWLTFAVSSYIKETGDRDILKQKFGYLKDKYIRGWDEDPEFKGAPFIGNEGSLYDHLWRSLDFCFHDVGEHGLPLIGYGDINDSVNAAGIERKGGSVWLACALVRSLKILARLSDFIDERAKATELRKRATIVTERIDAFWDGEWYARGITDDGFVFGSRKNKHGKVFLNAQVWAILSGVAQGEKLNKVFKTIDKYLETPQGLVSLQPAFAEYDNRIGEITRHAKGAGENASIVCADVAEMAIACCLTGYGDKAYQTIKKIISCAQKHPEQYKAEPYVLADSLIGKEHPWRSGEGVNSWTTASASVVFTAVTEWMLGIRPELNGLVIDPCIPRHWKKYHVHKYFRGAHYDITVENPHGVEKGIKEIFVNKERIYGNLITQNGNEKKYTVKVILGRTASKQNKKQKFLAAI